MYVRVSTLWSSIAVLESPALAQDADTSATSSRGGTLEEVVVTGSRVGRSTFNTPNPVTVMDAKDIENLGLTNVGEVLGQLPQNSNFFAANNVGLGNFNVGAQLANLRGLNPFFGTRTLTLIDTERVVPTATGGGVDVTLIPSMLVARTEVVTGWRVRRLRIWRRGRRGQHHPRPETQRVQSAGGLRRDLARRRRQQSFLAGLRQRLRGRPRPLHRRRRVPELGSHRPVLAGARLVQVGRWPVHEHALRRAPAGAGPAIPPNGQPHYIIGPNATLANQSQTGVLHRATRPRPSVSRSGRSMFSIPAGTAATPFNPGLYPDGAGVFGFSQGAVASGIGAYDGTTLRPSVKRYTGLANVDFKITDNLTSFLQMSYARSAAVNPLPTARLAPSRSKSRTAYSFPQQCYRTR